MRQVTPDEAKSELSQLIEAALRGEQIVIAQDDEHAVRLVPMATKRGTRRAGTGKGLFTIREDFDAPLDDFNRTTLKSTRSEIRAPSPVAPSPFRREDECACPQVTTGATAHKSTDRQRAGTWARIQASA